MKSAVKLLEEMVAALDLPPVVDKVRVPGEGTYCFTHVANRGAGDTAEAAIRAWAADISATLDTQKPDWIWWRLPPEIECSKDFEHNKLVFCVFSRMTTSSLGQRVK